MMEGYCPPHFRDMRAAVEALCERKFGPGGRFHPDTPVLGRSRKKSGPPPRSTARSLKNVWRSKRNTTFDRLGKFPGTVPLMIATIYLQAHHPDLEFYDDFFESGAYLRTHAHHMARRHGSRGSRRTVELGAEAPSRMERPHQI
jgi:hypothetical protein